jgi:hypothetical protein
MYVILIPYLKMMVSFFLSIFSVVVFKKFQFIIFCETHNIVTYQKITENESSALPVFSVFETTKF